MESIMRFAALLSFVLAIPVLLFAQPTWEQTWLEASVDHPARYTTGDIDGDGDSDVLVFTTEGEITWWENTNQIFTRHVIEEEGGGYYYSWRFSLGDIDNDGDMDILGWKSVDNEFHAFLQTDGEWEFWLPGFEIDFVVGTLAVIDIDADGDNDIVVGEHYREIPGSHQAYVFEFDNGIWNRLVSDTGLPATHMVVVDFDFDGDDDCVMWSTIDYTIYWLEWVNGNFVVHIVTSEQFSESGRGSLDVADIDFDGDSDIVVGSNENVTMLINDNGEWVVETIENEYVAGIDKCMFENVDDDEDWEIIASNGYGVDCWDFDGFAWDRTRIIEQWAFYNISTSDMDNDGDADILGTISGPSYIPWFENDDGDWEYHAVMSDAGALLNLQSIDMDGDGDQDIISEASSLIMFYENLPGDSLNRHELPVDIPRMRFLRYADFDNDGDYDFVTFDYGDENIYWIEQTENDLVAHLLIDLRADIESLEIIDSDENPGGGLVFVLDEQATMLSYSQNRWHQSNLATVPHMTRAIPADVDQDGDFDLVVKTESWRMGARFLWLEQVSADQSFVPHSIDNDLFQVRTMIMQDMDNDSDLDILTTTDSAFIPISWYENTGGQTWPQHDVGGVGVTGKRALPRDMDGDGDLDIVAGSVDRDNSGIGWFEKTGLDQYQYQHIADLNDLVSLEALDLDEDGDLDIVASIDHGETAIWWQHGGVFIPSSLNVIGVQPEASEVTIHPNPFNLSTTVTMQLSYSQQVGIGIYDVLGRKVAELANDKLEIGRHDFHFGASDLSSGVYFVRIVAEEYSTVRQLTLIK
jgi:FG-GAP-like repeat/Secretion system C-terminal sorting domain